MTVEQDPRIGPEIAHQRYPSGKLVNKESRWLELSELTADSDRKEEMELAEDGEEDLESTEKSGGEEGVASDSDIKGPYAYHCQFHVLHEMFRNSSGYVGTETML